MHKSAPLTPADALKTVKHGIDPRTGLHTVTIFSGGWYLATQPKEMLMTVLGSCVAACIRDPIAKIGGMNHFLLPGDEAQAISQTDSARYGVHAMESLIGAILDAGGQQARLEIKIFGGANLFGNSTRIGSQNAAFIRDFLRRNGFHPLAEDLEGSVPRRVHYYPDTGKVMLRRLHRNETPQLAQDELRYRTLITHPPIPAVND